MGEAGQDAEDGRDAVEYCGVEDRCDTGGLRHSITVITFTSRHPTNKSTMKHAKPSLNRLVIPHIPLQPPSTNPLNE